MSAKRLQIGVMGMGHDMEHSAQMTQLAFEIGVCIAKAGHITVYGANKDQETLPTDAARGAKSVGGLTVGVTHGVGRTILNQENTDVVVATGIEKGGGREFVLVNSCDAIILISGGAGTLIEAAIAYEMYIPMVALLGSGGWADKLAGTYLDPRNKVLIESAKTPQEAVELAVKAAMK